MSNSREWTDRPADLCDVDRMPALNWVQNSPALRAPSDSTPGTRPSSVTPTVVRAEVHCWSPGENLRCANETP